MGHRKPSVASKGNHHSRLRLQNITERQPIIGDGFQRCADNSDQPPKEQKFPRRGQDLFHSAHAIQQHRSAVGKPVAHTAIKANYTGRFAPSIPNQKERCKFKLPFLSQQGILRGRAIWNCRQPPQPVATAITSSSRFDISRTRARSLRPSRFDLF